MPTPAEQKALTFVALVVLLGGAARIVRGGGLASPVPTPAEQQAIARQALAADSAAAAAAVHAKGQKRRKVSQKAPRRRIAGAKFDSTGVLIEPASSLPQPVDLDVADTARIGRLPWVGPALARRIVASRDSLGPFGSLEALGRVKGVGPATLKRLAGLVTFSGQARR